MRPTIKICNYIPGSRGVNIVRSRPNKNCDINKNYARIFSVGGRYISDPVNIAFVLLCSLFI